MKHPYESAGIITSVLILGVVIVVGMFMMMPEMGHSGGAAAGGYNDIDQYIHSALPPKAVWDNYYKNNMDIQLDCKTTSNNLQEFYDCVNKP